MKNIYVVRPSLPSLEEYTSEIADIWESHQLTNAGEKYYQLQALLQRFFQVQQVELFCNGHLALEIGLSALELTGEVITTPFTFASTTQAIVRTGLTPVFCDIRPDDYTIDADQIESLVTERTTAILPVHVYGNLCDVEKIRHIAEKYNLKVIYDAAHAFGVSKSGVSSACFGDMSMFSFHATKVFHTVEGGCLTFHDAALAEKVSQLRQFGMHGQDDVPTVGLNAKMTEMHAAMGICNLRHIQENIDKRKRVFERYSERLSDIKGLSINRLKPAVSSNYAYFPVLFDRKAFNRDEIAEKLAKQGVFARKYFYPATNEFACYRGRFPIQETPIAKHVSENILCLPLYADLELDDVDFICDALLK